MAPRPSIYRVEQARKKLRRLLSSCRDSDLLRAVWCIDALQSGRQNSVVTHERMRFPSKAVSPPIESQYYCHEWRLETLVNECLTVKKQITEKRLNLKNHAAFAHLMNSLHAVEDLEIGRVLDKIGLGEIYRISKQQFPWQFGFVSRQIFHRYGFLYMFDEADNYFNELHEMKISDFTKCCFALFAQSAEAPAISGLIDLAPVGISDELRDKVLCLCSLPLEDAFAEVGRLRGEGRCAAYKPSILRTKPLIRIPSGSGASLHYVPLRSLLGQRMTSGLYYDLVGDDNLKRLMGRRFEEYCAWFLKSAFPMFHLEKERSYEAGKFHTPDIALCRDEKIRIVIECKSKKLTAAARFSETPARDASAGYEEMSKGIFQLWRFFYHFRLGKIPQFASYCISDSLGLVLTLDEWMEHSGSTLESVFSRAHSLANEARIEMKDRRPVSFVTMTDLELVGQRICERDFESVLTAKITDKYKTYELNSIGRIIVPKYDELEKAIEFPVNKFMPWWDEIRELEGVKAGG